MEPGHEDREYTRVWNECMNLLGMPQWSPAMKTGNTAHFQRALSFVQNASMEPGHEDREYTDPEYAAYSIGKPQWSPAMKTGNTGDAVSGVALGGHASMEPGHEDREYSPT